MNKRASGILMPVSSLPRPLMGIGCFSKEARAFVDWLADAGQTLWQILPLGPTSYGDSPYQSFSHLCGQPLFHRPRDAGPGGAAVCRGIAPPPTWAATPPTSTTANCTATAGPCCGRPLRHGVRRAAPGRRSTGSFWQRMRPGWRTMPSLWPSRTGRGAPHGDQWPDPLRPAPGGCPGPGPQRTGGRSGLPAVCAV